MRYDGEIFKNRKFDFDKLEDFGFKKESNFFVYNTPILNNLFKLTVIIDTEGKTETKIIDNSSGEEYNLLYVKNVKGQFVGKIKEEFENILIGIKNECTMPYVFKSKQAYQIIDYIKNKYGDKAEYLWEKFPENAVFRKRDNSKTGGKWYAAILTVNTDRIKPGIIGKSEVINLKAPPETVEKITDNKKYFKAYHMNKKHWYTICLDDLLDSDEIKQRIDESYATLR